MHPLRSSSRSKLLPLFLVIAFAGLFTGCGSVSTALRSRAAPVATVESAWPTAVRTGDVQSPIVTTIDTAQASRVTDDGLVAEAARALAPDVLMCRDAPFEPDGAIAPPATAGAASEEAAGAVTVADANRSDDAPPLLAQDKSRGAASEDDEDIEDYDPWEPFNEKMFEVNRRLDRYVLKPVAKVWDKVLPDEVQRMISSAFDNIGSFKRMFNSAFQRKWGGAGREAARFAINTTFGIGGLWDMAKKEFHIEKSNEDFGQTLGFYGVGAGPYLVIPLLPPMTVRDGIGTAVDSFLDPLGYLIPFIWERLAMKVTDVVNDRSLNLELFQGFEETVVDLYSAVRHAYLERRRSLIKE